MADPERLWYRIYKHILESGNDAILKGEVRGESRAFQVVTSLDAQLTDEEKTIGWTHYHGTGTTTRQTSSIKKAIGGRHSARPVRQNRRRP